ncbi:hypothetical protein ACF3OH_02215 [Chryseomicrobium aureum]|uniref:hypothetical protein n=1 Tax=Chryseomicrobium aureum TaxID=1441723 RepID=UPI00370D01FC
MGNELNNLKEAMDETVFEQAKFDSTSKQAVREALYSRKEKPFSAFAVVAAATLVLAILLGTTTWLQATLTSEQATVPTKQSTASVIDDAHIFEGMIFRGQTNPGDSFQFINGNLVIVTDPTMSAVRPWINPEDMPTEGVSEVTYTDIDVERDQSLFVIYSAGELIFELYQTGPRLYEDSEGNVFSTDQYIEEAEFLVARVEDFEYGFQIDGGQIFGNNAKGIIIYMGNLGMRDGNLSVLDEFLLEQGYNSTDSIYLEFPKAQITVENTKYFIQLNDEDSLEFEKVGKRIIKDANGREYYLNQMPE